MKQGLLLTAPTSTVQLTENWHVIKDGDEMARHLHSRHYSKYEYQDNRNNTRFVGPGERIVLITAENDALFVWRCFEDDWAKLNLSYGNERTLWCSIFRNESSHLSSLLIAEAERVAACRWPGKFMHTYVNPKEDQKCEPGLLL